MNLFGSKVVLQPYSYGLVWIENWSVRLGWSDMSPDLIRWRFFPRLPRSRSMDPFIELAFWFYEKSLQDEIHE